MQITDILGQIGGIQSVARELGVSEDQAASGAAALLPALLGGFKKQAQGHDGTGWPRRHAGRPRRRRLAGRRAGTAAHQRQPRQRRLGQIFGTKEVSRTVAQNAATRTGLDASLVKEMLPMLAMLVAGYMAKQSRATASPPMGGGFG